MSTFLKTSALVVRSFNQTIPSDNRQKRERPCCEHCKRVGHIKETCWKLHGKTFDWKPRHCNDRRGKAYMVNLAPNNSITSKPTMCSKEQIESLQKIIGQTIQEAGLVAQKVVPTALTASKRGMQPWIVEIGESNHMNRMHLYFTIKLTPQIPL